MSLVYEVLDYSSIVGNYIVSYYYGSNVTYLMDTPLFLQLVHSPKHSYGQSLPCARVKVLI